MQAAGMKEIEQAKLDGRWKAAYAPQSKATGPRDLQRVLDRNPCRDGAHFDRLDRVNRYAILYRVHDAKKPETRGPTNQTVRDDAEPRGDDSSREAEAGTVKRLVK